MLVGLSHYFAAVYILDLLSFANLIPYPNKSAGYRWCNVTSGSSLFTSNFVLGCADYFSDGATLKVVQERLNSFMIRFINHILSHPISSKRSLGESELSDRRLSWLSGWVLFTRKENYELKNFRNLRI